MRRPVALTPRAMSSQIWKQRPRTEMLNRFRIPIWSSRRLDLLKLTCDVYLSFFTYFPNIPGCLSGRMQNLKQKLFLVPLSSYFVLFLHGQLRSNASFRLFSEFYSSQGAWKKTHNERRSYFLLSNANDDTDIYMLCTPNSRHAFRHVSLS
jgi:hypothetical protein